MKETNIQNIHAITNPGHQFWPTGIDAAHHAIAAKIHTAEFVVCDLNLQGVQGCADMRNAALRGEMIAELIATGIIVFVIGIVSAIGVAFVHLFAAAWRRRQKRKSAHSPRPIIELTNA